MVEITTIIGIFAFLVLLFYMAITVGTQGSISQLAKNYRWLLLVALWTLILLLPLMIDITPTEYLWIPFIGMFGIIICGGANVFNSEDNLIHMIAAIIAFICFIVWILIINPRCILPIIICLTAGKENLIWRAEIGLIISVYLILIL